MDYTRKLAHNLEVLTTTKRMVFIYVPKQFGKLSKHTHRAKVLEVYLVNEGNSIKKYKLLKIYNHDGTERRIIWWHKKIKHDYRGRFYEHSFEIYTEEEWEAIKNRANHEKLDRMVKSLTGDSLEGRNREQSGQEMNFSF